MNNLNMHLLYLAGLILLTSCNIDVPEKQETTLFDLEATIKTQLNLLDSITPEVIKFSRVNEKMDTARLKPDSTQWASELEFFIKANINKPGVKENYDIVTDTSGNDVTITYKLTDEALSGIDHLNVYFTDNRLTNLEAFYHEENIIFFTERNLLMNFTQNDEGQLFIKDFSVIGKQKMMLMDSVKFNVHSKIQWPKATF